MPRHRLYYQLWNTSHSEAETGRLSTTIQVEDFLETDEEMKISMMKIDKTQ